MEIEKIRPGSLRAADGADRAALMERRLSAIADALRVSPTATTTETTVTAEQAAKVRD